MATNKYASVISSLLAGDVLTLKIEEGMNPETLRTALSKEKTRQEEMMKAFEIPVPASRLRFKRQGANGTYKVSIELFNLGFEILSSPPAEPANNCGECDVDWPCFNSIQDCMRK